MSGTQILGFKKDISAVSAKYPLGKITIPDTRICFEKKIEDSYIKITYQDNIYYEKHCEIHPVLDDVHLKGNEIGPKRFFNHDVDAVNLSWIEELSAGNHCVEMSLYALSYRCTTGYSESNLPVNNFILVEELQF